MSDGFGQLLALVEKLVNIYNEALAGDIERSERLLMETGDGQDESPLTIDLAGLVETVQGSAREQVAFLVDMAKADALDLLGETRQAFELVETVTFELQTLCANSVCGPWLFVGWEVAPKFLLG